MGYEGDAVSYTLFCPRGSVRALASHQLLVVCVSCPTEHGSTGGSSHACMPCSGVQCAELGQVDFRTAFAADQSGLTTDDRILVHVDAYTAAELSEPQAIADSNIVLVDFTPPVVGFVNDGTPGLNKTDGSEENELDVDFILAGSTLKAWWGDFYDLQSPIAHYEVCAGSAPELCDIVPPQVVGATNRTLAAMNRTSNMSSVSHEFQLPSTPDHDQKLCVGVQAVNEAGLRSVMESTDCVRVDKTCVPRALDPAPAVTRRPTVAWRPRPDPHPPLVARPLLRRRRLQDVASRLPSP